MRDDEKDPEEGEDADTVPGAPSESDDTAAGDTDQHSDADA
jgi:hypothetical protein